MIIWICDYCGGESPCRYIQGDFAVDVPRHCPAGGSAEWRMEAPDDE